MSSDQKIFPKKYAKKLDEFAQGYVESAESANTEDLKKFILTAEQNLYDIEYEIENNPNLLKVKDELKKELAPFNEAKQTEVAKIKLCLFILEQRGVKI